MQTLYQARHLAPGFRAVNSAICGERPGKAEGRFGAGGFTAHGPHLALTRPAIQLMHFSLHLVNPASSYPITVE
jgi:hypothetical protein